MIIYMKRISFCGALALMLVCVMTLCSWTSPEMPDKKQAEGVYKREVKVATGREFVEALQSDTRIHVVTSEPLNISHAIEQMAQEGKIKHMPGEGQGEAEPGVYYTREYDGLSIVIHRLHNLCIVGEDKKAGGNLLVIPRYADVLKFDQCRDIVIDNMVMGHEEAGTCVGDVVVLDGCANVAIRKSMLYGCGVDGLSAYRSANIQVSGSDIYGCSDYAIMLFGTGHVAFEGCRIHDNGLGIRVDEECDGVSFTKCEMHDNRGCLFFCDVPVTLTKCKVHHTYDDQAENINFVQSKVVMNLDNAENYPDIGEGE